MRFGIAVGFSLLAHALLLSLQFGIPGIGLPTLEMPWKERRAQAKNLNVSLALPPPAAMNQEQSSGTAHSPAPLAPEASTSPANPPSHGLQLISPEALLPPAPPAPDKPVSGKSARVRKAKPPAAQQAPRRRTPSRAKVEQPVIALNDARPESFVVAPPALDEIEPLPATPPGTPEEATPFSEADLKQQEDSAAQARALEEQQAADAEHARQQEAEDAARRAAEALALQQQEEALRRTQALDTAKEEARRQQEEEQRKLAERQATELAARQQAEEAARQQAEALALQQQEETARQALELARQREEERRLELAARKQADDAARAQAAELARRQAEELSARERARELAARQKAEAEMEEAAAPPAPNAPAAQRHGQELVLDGSPSGGRPDISGLPKNPAGGLAGKALEQARRPDILRNDAPLARKADESATDSRRRSVFGSNDRDVGLLMYVESWRMKIERNGNLNYAQSSVDKARGDPVVTVSIRSDGSVEEVIINRSSGRSELDEAVRRIVRINARYSNFPPELARRFDVIEIRRIWSFDDKLRILEEVR